MSERTSFFSQPFAIQWRKALVSAPRIVPLGVLKYTSAEGPHPFILNLPSRGKYLIPCYVFVPATIEESDVANGLPVVIDFHGGGFVLGSCLEQGPFCSKMARDLGAVVICVDYRMGPIDKFPAAIEDGEDVLNAVLDEDSKGGKELRDAVARRLSADEKKALKKARKELKRKTKREKKAKAKKTDFLEVKRPQLSRTSTQSTLVSLEEPVIIDKSRIILSGFSSGGNLILNLALSLPGEPPLKEDWPSRFPPSYSTPIPLLLYYPSFDCRQLPSERTKPEGLIEEKGFWSNATDMLMVTYLPRDQAGHPRASPGLAELKYGVAEEHSPYGLHKMARMHLVLPVLDTLSEQSEIWVKKVQAQGRGEHLLVERYQGMKHGWTQMPESWLSADERRARLEAFERSICFVRECWAAGGQDGVEIRDV